MNYNYYLDESGNSGDLIGKSESLSFGNQPIFSLACLGVEDESSLNDFFQSLTDKYELDEDELKSTDLYFKKPEVFLDLATFISQYSITLLVEVVDKKYCIATQIVNHNIMPPYFMPDESERKAQFIRNGLADFLATSLPDDLFKKYYSVCKARTERSLINFMTELKNFFEIKSNPNNINDFHGLTVKMIEESIDDYMVMKERFNESKALERFIPIPDYTEKGLRINLLPHVHSIFNLMARLNKYHIKNVNNVNLYHDKQSEFKHILTQSKEYIESQNIENIPHIDNCDFDFVEKLNLQFLDSKQSGGVQAADLVAGFFNRYINGLLYKELEVDDIYHSIFFEFRKNFIPSSPLGVNFVLPESKQNIIFRMFNF